MRGRTINERERKNKNENQTSEQEEQKKEPMTSQKRRHRRLTNRKRKCKTNQTLPQRVIITLPQAALDDRANSHQLRRPELQIKPLTTVGAVYIS